MKADASLWVVVEQGPEFLARIAYNYPKWAPWVVAGVIGAVIVVGALGSRKVALADDAEREEVANELVGVSLVVVGAGAGTYLSRTYLDLSYSLDVGVGAVLAVVAWIGWNYHIAKSAQISR